MIYRVIVPDVGATGGGVTLSEWLVKPNDFVRTGSPLFVVTTDKADMEVEAFHDGYLREILVPAGTAIALGALVAVMADSREESLDLLASQPGTEVPELSRDHREAGAQADHKGSGTSLYFTGEERPRVAEAISSDRGAEGKKVERILASPLARRLAQEMGTDLNSVRGSGEGGVIHRRDVLSAAAGQTMSPLAEISTGLIGGVRRTPVSPMRRAIADRTKRSKAEAPHFYVTAVIDMTDAEAFLEEAATLAKERKWVKPSVTDLAIRAAALALRVTPQLNASFHEEEIVYFEGIHIGLVIGLADGMVVPVILNADQKDIFTLAATRHRLREKATAGTLSRTELVGSTFTISNLGMYGVESFAAVINPPEAAILALGTVRKRPAFWEGRILPRAEMMVTLSADHRLVDGIVAGQFLKKFKDFLENPVRLTLTSPEVRP